MLHTAVLHLVRKAHLAPASIHCRRNKTLFFTPTPTLMPSSAAAVATTAAAAAAATAAGEGASKRTKGVELEERLFSLGSVTSPATKSLQKLEEAKRKAAAGGGGGGGGIGSSGRRCRPQDSPGEEVLHETIGQQERQEGQQHGQEKEAINARSQKLSPSSRGTCCFWLVGGYRAVYF